MVLKFYDRFPNKPLSVTGAADVYTITFPLISTKLETIPILKITQLETSNQTIFKHVLVND